MIRALAFFLGALLAVLPQANGYARPLKPREMMTSEERMEMMQAACTGQSGRSVCDVFGFNKYFIKCGTAGTPERKICGKGERYDYVQRKCLDMDDVMLKTCPTYHCPVNTRGPGVAPPQGTFGQPGNATFMLDQGAEQFSLFCPVDGHCVGGMYFNVDVMCPAPADRYPYTFVIYPFMEYLMPNASYPMIGGDIHAYCGDSIYVEWEEPVHLVTTFGRGSSEEDLYEASIYPAPPQPVYECPMWEADEEGRAIPREDMGDVVLLEEGVGPKRFQWRARRVGSFMMICQALPAHCRMGMIFKVTVERCQGVRPTTYNINWVLTYDLYEDMQLCFNDRLIFEWDSQFMYHGLMLVPAENVPMVVP